jgi:hypothetical protein
MIRADMKKGRGMEGDVMSVSGVGEENGRA